MNDLIVTVLKILNCIDIWRFKGETMKIALPSMAPGGLEAEISAHFGHSDVFTMVTIEDKKIASSELVQNPPHAQGGCMAPVMLLKENGADAIIVTGIGMRPLMGFQQVGIKVFSGVAGTIESVVKEYLAGRLQPAGEDIVCGHSKDSPC